MLCIYQTDSNVSKIVLAGHKLLGLYVTEELVREMVIVALETKYLKLTLSSRKNCIAVITCVATSSHNECNQLR